MWPLSISTSLASLFLASSSLAFCAFREGWWILFFDSGHTADMVYRPVLPWDPHMSYYKWDQKEDVSGAQIFWTWWSLGGENNSNSHVFLSYFNGQYSFHTPKSPKAQCFNRTLEPLLPPCLASNEKFTRLLYAFVIYNLEAASQHTKTIDQRSPNLEITGISTNQTLRTFRRCFQKRTPKATNP